MNKLAVTLLAALGAFNVPQRAGMSATTLLKPERYNKYETHRGNGARECARRVRQMERNITRTGQRIVRETVKHLEGVPA